jgi:hypothetical protein
MISGQGKADEGDKHGIQLPACSEEHLFQEHTKFLKICKMRMSFVCKTNKQIGMSYVFKYSGALFGRLGNIQHIKHFNP